MNLQITDTFFNEKRGILQALDAVIDPELSISITDLGLVYEIIIEDSEITINMTLSTRPCPIGTFLTAQVQMVAEKAMPDYRVNVCLVWEPQWNAEKISEEGKALLGW